MVSALLSDEGRTVESTKCLPLPLLVFGLRLIPGYLLISLPEKIDLIEELRHRHDLRALNLVTTYLILHTAAS